MVKYPLLLCFAWLFVSFDIRCAAKYRYTLCFLIGIYSAGFFQVDYKVLLLFIGIVAAAVLFSLIVRAAIELALSWDRPRYYRSQMRLDDGAEKRQWQRARRRVLRNIFAPSSFFEPVLHPVRMLRGDSSHHRHHRHHHGGHGGSHGGAHGAEHGGAHDGHGDTHDGHGDNGGSGED